MLEGDFEGLESHKVLPKLQSIKDKLKKFPEEDQKNFETELNELIKKAKLIKKQKELEELEEYERQLEKIRQEELKKEREELKRLEYERQIIELFNFMKSMNSSKALPLNKAYSKSVIDQASWRMTKYLNEKEELQRIRDEAIVYYNSHSLKTQPYLEEDREKEIYAQVRGEIKNKTLTLNHSGNFEYKGNKLEKVFYRARELTTEERERAKLQGFTYVRGNELDGHVSGGFYIQKQESTETNYHFYLKYLFAELHENMYVEHQVGSKRADVALLINGFSLAIEIETGKNRAEYLKEKVAWLNENFTQWIIVCKKPLLPRYSQFVDNENSFCLTPKEAKKHIEELCFYH